MAPPVTWVALLYLSARTRLRPGLRPDAGGREPDADVCRIGGTMIAAVLFVIASFGAPVPWQKDPAMTSRYGEWTGTVQTGIMAIGGESTGMRLMTGTDQLELTATDGVLERLRELNGQQVTLLGRLDTRAGVEIRTRRIITVTEVRRPSPSVQRRTTPALYRMFFGRMEWPERVASLPVEVQPSSRSDTRGGGRCHRRRAHAATRHGNVPARFAGRAHRVLGAIRGKGSHRLREGRRRSLANGKATRTVPSTKPRRPRSTSLPIRRRRCVRTSSSLSSIGCGRRSKPRSAGRVAGQDVSAFARDGPQERARRQNTGTVWERINASSRSADQSAGCGHRFRHVQLPSTSRRTRANEPGNAVRSSPSSSAGRHDRRAADAAACWQRGTTAAAARCRRDVRRRADFRRRR